MILTGPLRPPARHRKHDRVTEHSARFRAETDHLWRGVFDDARRDIDYAAEHGWPWCRVRLPHPADDDMHQAFAETMGYAAERGYPNMRPGSPAGHGCDFIRLERVA